MAPQHWILMAILGLTAALGPVPQRAHAESLRGALDAVARKQRSLNASPQDYYLELPTLRLRDSDSGADLRRQQVGGDAIHAKVNANANANDNDADEDDGLAFIPPGAGQVETIGEGYQHLSNRQYLDRALMDYLQYGTDQDQRAGQQQQQQQHEQHEAGAGGGGRSVFRERERTGSRKRTSSGAGGREELLRELMLSQQRPQLGYQPAAYGSSSSSSSNDEEYWQQLQLLSRLLEQERQQEREDDRLMLLSPVERRNVNARYPLFDRDEPFSYAAARRRSLAKRSAKSAATKERQAKLEVDPKVAQDLHALFGADKVNRSRELGREHGPGEVPRGDRKEANATAERSIALRKKSVDWSQYFGIDRRKKKTVYAAKPGTRDQDNEYLLQKYYEIMAEHLKPGGKNAGGEKRADQLQRMDSELRDMKNLMIEEAAQVSSRNDMDSQQVKDEIMSRLAAAYSLEKLRRALNELSSSGAGGPPGTRQPANGTANENDKRNQPRGRASEEALQRSKSCPQLGLIEARCRGNEALVPNFREALHLPYVMYHVCIVCAQDDCLERFALEVEKVCEEEDEEQQRQEEEYEAEEEGEEELQLKGLPSGGAGRHCIRDALLLTRYRPESLAAASGLCRARSCLDLYQKYSVRAYPRAYDSPYAVFSRDRRAVVVNR